MSVTSIGGLSFTDFAKKYNLNDVEFIDKFYQNIDKKLPLLFDKQLIEKFGFPGSATMQKNQIMKLIAGLPRDLAEGVIDLPILDYNDYYLSSGDYSLSLPDPRSLKNTNQTIITFKTFKHLLMLSNTQKGYKFRSYFMAIEEINDHYKTYINKLLNYQISKCESKLLASEDQQIDLQDEIEELRTTNAYLTKKSKLDAIEYKVEISHLNRCAKYDADVAEIELADLRSRLVAASQASAVPAAGSIQIVILVRYKIKETYDDIWWFAMIKTKNTQRRINTIKKKYINYKFEVCNVVLSGSLLVWQSICGNYSIKVDKLNLNNWFEISQ
jgi:hypothetical protein